MSSSWKKFRTALRFLQMAKGFEIMEKSANSRDLVQNQIAILQKPPEERTDEDLGMLDEILKSVKFTGDLPLRVRLEICKKCTHRQGAPGQELFKQGESGNDFFIILSGIVTCSAINTLTGQASVVARLTVHESFGESGLQSKSRLRQETATIESRCDLLVVSKDSFDIINQYLQSSETHKKVSFLKKMGVFAQLPPAGLQVIADAMAARTCPKGSVIKRQGDDSTEVYFLVTGTCRIIRYVSFSPHESFQLSTLSLVRDAIASASEAAAARASIAAAARKRPEDPLGTILGLPLAPSSAAETIVLPASLAEQVDESGVKAVAVNGEASNGKTESDGLERGRFEGESAEGRLSEGVEQLEAGRKFRKSNGSSSSLAAGEEDADDVADVENVSAAETPDARKSRSASRVSFYRSPGSPQSSLPASPMGKKRSGSSLSRRKTTDSVAGAQSPTLSTSGRDQNDARSFADGRHSGSPQPRSTGRSSRALLEPFLPGGINTSHGERIYPWERRTKSPTKARARARSASPVRPRESPRALRARASADVYSNKQMTVAEMLRTVPKRREKSRRLFLELGQILPPAYFGEAGVLRNEPGRTSIVAATNVELYVLNKLDFQVRVGRDVIKQMEQRIPEFPSDDTIRRIFLKNVLWSNYKAALVSEVTAHRTGTGKPTSAVPLPSCNFRQPDGQTVRLPRLLERKAKSPTPNVKLLKGAVMSIPTP